MPILSPQVGHVALVLPLCTSSISVGLSLFQYPLYSAFLKREDSSSTKAKSIAGRPLSHHWKNSTSSVGPFIASICLTSTASGLVASRWLRTHKTLETTSVAKWYAIGAALAAAHLLFVPAVAGPIRRMTSVGLESVDDETVDEYNRKQMKTWFTWHTVRTILVDIPALACFAEGAALSFWVI